MTSFINSVSKPHPHDYDLPHDSWREGQFETVQWALENEGVMILEVETGGGKTGIATAISSRHSTTALCRTKVLQEANYKDTYKWDELFGRSNYDCVHPDATKGTKADQCLYAEKGMYKCPWANSCPYLVQKLKVRSSDRRSLNYPYYLLSYWVKNEASEYLVLDEAHQLSDITLDFAGLDIHDVARKKWDLPNFPTINTSSSSFRPVLFSGETDKPEDVLLKWMRASLTILRDTIIGLSAKAISGDEDAKKKARSCEYLIREIESTINAIVTDDRDWFIRSGSNVGYYRGKTVPGLIARPLTARYHFPRLFLNSPNTLIMSATIGDPETFATELGVENDFLFRHVPSMWKPEVRPVYLLDCPPMGKSATSKNPSYWEKQADEIANFIKKYPKDKCGLIHINSIKKGYDLAERLSLRGLEDRIWVTPRKGTNHQLAAWEERKRKVPNSIAIAWAFKEGVDMWDEFFNIDAGIAFPNIGDPYEFARLKFDNRFYRQRAAWTTHQKMGRNRRGVPEHYNLNGKETRANAIADANVKMIRKYLSDDFVESLVEL